MAFVKYEDLDVYKLAYGLALEIHKVTLGFPKFEQYGGMADQLRRASKSVCANMAEGMSKTGSSTEEIRFLRIARGSAEECRVWIRFCLDLDYVTPQQGESWRNDYTRIGQMLMGLIEKRGVKA